MTLRQPQRLPRSFPFDPRLNDHPFLLKFLQVAYASKKVVAPWPESILTLVQAEDEYLQRYTSAHTVCTEERILGQIPKGWTSANVLALLKFVTCFDCKINGEPYMNRRTVDNTPFTKLCARIYFPKEAVPHIERMEHSSDVIP